MKGAFEGRSVIRVDHGVSVEAERDAGVTKLFYPIVWFKPPRQADLDYILAKGELDPPKRSRAGAFKGRARRERSEAGLSTGIDLR